MKEEVEVDKTDVNIPNGWQRKLFKLISGPNIGQYKMLYFSIHGRQVWGKKQMEQHLNVKEKRYSFVSRC